MDVDLEIRPSRQLRVGGVLLHLGAVLAVCMTAMSVPWTAAGVPVLAWLAVRYAAGGYRPPYSRIVLRDGVVRLDSQTDSFHVSPPQVRFMAAGLLLLRFRHRLAGQKQRHRHLLLVPDSLSSNDRRVLYRYLGGWSAA